MKKFSIKSLLVLVLVLVLVLSIVLVSCNKKKNEDPQPGGGGGSVTPDPDPQPGEGEIDKDSYFGNMWELANDIGGEAITANDNVALSLDLSVAMRQLKAGKVEAENFNIGIKLDLVLDRTTKEGTTPKATNSAVRALIYNASTGETWCAVYYFLSDPNFLYIDLNGAQNVEFLSGIVKDRFYKVAFVTDGNNNASYAGSVADFINNHKFAEKEGVADSGFTIADIVNAVVRGTGADWTLNTLIENIAGIFNLDLKGIAKSVGSLLPGIYDEATNSVHIENALSSSIVKSLLGEPTTTVGQDGRKEYAVSLNVGRILSLASDMLKDLPAMVKLILNENTEFGIKYGEKDGKLDGFALSLGLKGMIDAKTNLYPQVELSINNLELRKVANTAAEAKAKVGFEANNWADATTIDLNTLCQGVATIEVELYKNSTHGEMTPYRVTAYSDIDIIDTIVKIVKMTNEDKTWAERVAILKDMHFEIGMKAEEIDENGALVPDAEIPFQILLSAPKAEASIVIGEKSYIIDIASILASFDTPQGQDDSQGSVDEGGTSSPAPTGNTSADAMSIIQGIMDAFNIIKETVKINGAELSLDAVKAIFFDENGELKENWHEFTLDANFTKKICDDICAKFGATNDNEVSVNIQKTAKGCTARAEYLNNAGKDATGKDVMDNYFVEITSSWDFDQNKFAIELKFDMWDKNANDGKGAKVTYDCKYEGALVFDEFEATEEEPAYKLLKSGQATLSLTRQYAGATAAESVFVAKLTGAINYNAAKDSITNASIDLVVKKDSAETTEPYFTVNGALTVSGTGKVLVKFVEGRPQYTATDGVIVDTRVTETLLKWIGQLDVDQDGTEVQIKNYKLPANILAALKKAGLVEDEVTELNIGQLLGACNINAEAANVISTHYEKHVLANDVEQELFTIGLNETETKTMHLGFEFRRNAEGTPTYVKCVYNLGEGDTGLAIKFDTLKFGKEIVAANRVNAAPRGENANVIDGSNFMQVIGEIMSKF